MRAISYLKNVFTLNSFSREKILRERHTTSINSHVHRHTVHTQEVVSTAPQKSTKSKPKGSDHLLTHLTSQFRGKGSLQSEVSGQIEERGGG